jgi:hypothetical protein
MSQVFQDPSAGQRLARHVREVEVDGLGGPQQRAIGTGAVAGLTPPLGLVRCYRTGRGRFRCERIREGLNLEGAPTLVGVRVGVRTLCLRILTNL